MVVWNLRGGGGGGRRGPPGGGDVEGVKRSAVVAETDGDTVDVDLIFVAAAAAAAAAVEKVVGSDNWQHEQPHGDAGAGIDTDQADTHSVEYTVASGTAEAQHTVDAVAADCSAMNFAASCD